MTSTLWNNKEVATFLNVKESTIRYWVHIGYIPHIKFRGAVRFRESDIVARWGGDEFVALIGEGGETVADLIDARLQAAIAALRPAGFILPISASVGMSALDPTLPLAEALEKADAELYRKKRRNSGATRRVDPPV